MMDDYRNNADNFCAIPAQRASMGLADRRKTTQNLVDSRKNWNILTVSRKLGKKS